MYIPRERLNEGYYLYQAVLDSITKFKGIDTARARTILEGVFSICYELKHYDLCVDVGMQLQDKGLLSRLIPKKPGVEANLKLLDYLKDDMPEVVEQELKELAELLIERKGDYAYAKAVECSFVLRKILDDAAWQEYIKGLYERHSRKINLWREFKRNGVTVKKVNGVIMLES